MGPRKERTRDPGSHIGFLDEVEREPTKRSRRRDGDDLDLDRIW